MGTSRDENGARVANRDGGGIESGSAGGVTPPKISSGGPPMRLMLNTSDRDLAGTALQALANSTGHMGTPTIGLLTSESPDAVAAWQGRKKNLYGKPFLACDDAARVLVLPAPVFTLWPHWMKLRQGSQVSQSMTLDNVMGVASSTLQMQGAIRRSSSIRPNDLKRLSSRHAPSSSTNASNATVPDTYVQT